MNDDSHATDDNAWVYISIEGGEDPIFPALLNKPPCVLCGSVKPAFSRDVADNVITWRNDTSAKLGTGPFCEWTHDGKIMVYASTERPCGYEICSPDQDGRYSLGEGAWAWRLREPNDEPPPNCTRFVVITPDGDLLEKIGPADSDALMKLICDVIGSRALQSVSLADRDMAATIFVDEEPHAAPGNDFATVVAYGINGSILQHFRGTAVLLGEMSPEGHQLSLSSAATKYARSVVTLARAGKLTPNDVNRVQVQK